MAPGVQGAGSRAQEQRLMGRPPLPSARTDAQRQRKARERHNAYLAQLERIEQAARAIIEGGPLPSEHDWLALSRALENTQGT